MASNTFVVGLSGREIIKDILHQVDKGLHKDCNLRDSDSYGQGYSGKITFELKLQALDTVVVTIPVEVQATSELQGQAAQKQPEQVEVPEGSTAEQIVKDVEVKAVTEIGEEQDLNMVRERSKQALPQGSVGGAGDPGAEQNETGDSTVKRRTYRNPVEGGAMEAPEGL